MPLRCVSLIACALAGAAVLVAAPVAEAQEVSPLVAYRKATMNGIRIHREALAALASGEVTHPDHVAYHTSAILGLAMMSGDIFPAGSGGEGSRALPAIWDNGGGFATQMSAFQAAARDLDAAARSGNPETLTAAMGTFGRTCASCHGDFRGPAN